VNKNILKQAQQMQAQISKAQAELAEMHTEGSAGGGVVKVVLVGGATLESIQISPEAVDPEDVEILQDLIVAAVNNAVTTAQHQTSEKMSSITGGLNVPGLGGLPGFS